ncbi:MAG: DUF1631 family protein [Pseudomonadota bacterium]
MAPALNNVVAFNPARATRRQTVSVDSTGLINGCREPALARICVALSQAFDKIEDERRSFGNLANALVAIAGEVSHQYPRYRNMEVIVERIHGEFDNDIVLFDKMMDEFEVFLRERVTTNAQIFEQPARAMHEREKREMARSVARDETEQHANITGLPAPVSALLKGPWSRALERVYLRDGGRSARFLETVETGKRLVWSVQPKSKQGNVVIWLPRYRCC